MPRSTWLLILVAWLLADSPARAAECPTGATWQGAPPPRGDGYFCAKPDPSGGLVRHGWAVMFDRFTTFKREECEYLNDQLHGRCTRYDADGNRTERGYHEHGKRAREWWFWSLPSAREPSQRVRLPAGATATPAQLVERRAVLHQLLLDLGAAETEAQGLTQHALEYIDDAGAKRQLVCGDHVCMGPGRADEPLYVKLGPGAAEVERDREVLAALQTRAQAAVDKESKQIEVARRQAAAEQQRKIKEYRAAVAKYKKLSRQWDYTRLRCNDGTRSPSCVCGGSWQGCCSWHGGVDGCPRDPPEAPTPPPGISIEDE